MRNKKRHTSRSARAVRARLLLSTSQSQRSSSGTSTETQLALICLPKRELRQGKPRRTRKSKFQRGEYVSQKTGRTEVYDSSYELRRFKALDENKLVEDWGRPKFTIRYRLGKSRRFRNYHPDILVRYVDGKVFLEEVKGRIYNPRQFMHKNIMARAYCAERNWIYRIIYEDDLEKTF